MAVAIPICSRVPMMAFSAPPPLSDSDTPLIEWVKNVQSNRLAPWAMVNPSTDASGAIAATNAAATSAVTNRSTARRRPS